MHAAAATALLAALAAAAPAAPQKRSTCTVTPATSLTTFQLGAFTDPAARASFPLQLTAGSGTQQILSYTVSNVTVGDPAASFGYVAQHQALTTSKVNVENEAQLQYSQGVGNTAPVVFDYSLAQPGHGAGIVPLQASGDGCAAGVFFSSSDFMTPKDWPADLDVWYLCPVPGGPDGLQEIYYGAPPQGPPGVADGCKKVWLRPLPNPSA